MKSEKRNQGSLTGRIVAFVIILILAVLWALPLIWALGTSFKDNYDIIYNPTAILPTAGHWTFDNYTAFLGDPIRPLEKWILNSLIAAFGTMCFTLIVVSLAAYSFVFVDWKGRTAVYSLILVTIMIPNIAGLVPMYSMINGFDWAGSLIALIIPGCANATLLFIVRQFFLGIPHELIESAKVDGANSFKTFVRVVLPLGKSPLILTALFSFMWNWNDMLWPQIVMNGATSDMWTLPSGMLYLANAQDAQYANIIAAAILSSLPVVILYLILQRYIIQGVSRSGLK